MQDIGIGIYVIIFFIILLIMGLLFKILDELREIKEILKEKGS